MEPLPRGWAWATVRDIGEVKLGRQRSPKHHFGPNMHPYLRVANVFEDRIDISDVMQMNFTPTEFQQYRLRPGDVLLNEGQSLELVGRPAIFKGEIEEACFQNTLIRFRAGAAVDPEFALIVFRTYLHTGRFRELARWTTSIAHLGADRFGAMPFPVPPMAEQRRIASAIEEQFTRLDAAVASLQRARANIKRHRASIMAAAVTGQLVPTTDTQGRQGPRLRAISEGTDLADLYHLPDGWSWSTLGDLATYLRNGIGTKPDANSGTPVLRISAVRPLNVNMADVRFFSQSVEELSSYTLERGDLLFTRYNGNPDLVGVCGMVRHVDQPTVHPDKLIKVKVDPRKALPEFLEVALNTSVSRNHVARRVRTTAGQSGVSGSDLRTIPVPLPPIYEQERIADEVERRLSAIEGARVSVEANLKRAQRLRQAILKRAFDGRLVPQDPTDEPASFLIQRLGANGVVSSGEVQKAQQAPKRVTSAKRAQQAPLPI